MKNSTANNIKPRNERGWFEWHSWLGLISGVLLFIVCWGGTFATVSHEIDWLLNPALRVAPEGSPASMADVYELANARFPNADILSISPPQYKSFAYDLIIKTQEQETRHLYIDPYSLEITGSSSFMNVQRFMRDFHRRLLLGNFGFYLVCLTAIPLAASMITALVFVSRWWQYFFHIKRGKKVRNTVSNLHRFAGVWSMWFILLISVTGSWYLIEKLRSQTLDEKFSYVDAFAGAVSPLPALDSPDTEQLTFRQLLTIAEQARPDMTIGSVALDRRGYFYVVGQSTHWLVRDRANKLFIDPLDGDIIYNQKASDLPPYWYWSNMADPLHFGTFAGLATKSIWFVFGLGLSFLSLSGVWLFAKRLQKNKPYQKKIKFSLGATTVTALILVLAIPAFFTYIQRLGPTLSGVKASAEPAYGALIFIGVWSAVTLAITLSWLKVIWTPLTHKKP